MYIDPSLSSLKLCQLYLSNQIDKFFRKVETINGWLFAVKNPETVWIKCHGKGPESVKLQGTGILYLRSNCKATCGELLLPSFTSLKTVSQYIYSPNMSLDLKLLLNNAKLYENIPKLLPEPDFSKSKINYSLEDTAFALEAIEEKYRDLKESLKKPMYKSVNSEYTHVTLFSVFSIVVLFLIIRRCFC